MQAPMTLSRSKRSIKTGEVIVDGRLFLLVEDLASGRRNRFTLYKIKLGGDKATKIIGREITQGDAKKLIVKHTSRAELIAKHTTRG